MACCQQDHELVYFINGVNIYRLWSGKTLKQIKIRCDACHTLFKEGDNFLACNSDDYMFCDNCAGKHLQPEIFEF